MKRKCKQCKEFVNEGIKTPTGFFCCFEHALEFAKMKSQKTKDKAAKQKAKQERAEQKERKEKAKSKGDWLALAQKAFNAYIRARDQNEPCISCGRHFTCLATAGHFLTVGARPEHRFNKDNCHRQCVRCNHFLSGNVAQYRLNLIKKIGLERVESMERDHKPKHYSVEDLKDLIKKYKSKLKKELLNER